MNMIETKNLTKQYGPKTAVNSLSLGIGKGELFSLLGVNGAGKTTTIRMLTCLSVPTSGEAYVNGFSCTGESEKIKPLIGISTQDTAVAERLTVKENLEFMARLYGFGKEKTAERVNRTVADFQLEEVLDQRAGTLSGGWKRKLSIAMALIGEPSVLFLDEPTLGLDVLARRELWRVIEAMKGSLTIVLTTHYLEEAEALADRIGIMHDGALTALGTADELKALSRTDNIEDAFLALTGADEMEVER